MDGTSLQAKLYRSRRRTSGSDEILEEGRQKKLFDPKSLSGHDRDRLADLITGVHNNCGRVYELPSQREGAGPGAFDHIDELWDDIMELEKKIKTPESKKMKGLAKDLQKAKNLLKKVVPQIKRLNDQLDRDSGLWD